MAFLTAGGPLRQPVEEPVNAPDETVDVLVVGSGGGVAGAYTAAREGLSVALVEATDQFGGTFAYSGGGGMWFPCNPVLVRAGCDDTIDEALRYYRSVVGDRTPAELQETYVRGGAALIEYLERDEHFAFKILPWPDYYSSVAGARNDGMRHIVSKAVPDNRLGRFQGLVRGPLDHERLGAPQPDLLTGGRARRRPVPLRDGRQSRRGRPSEHEPRRADRRRRPRRRCAWWSARASGG